MMRQQATKSNSSNRQAFSTLCLFCAINISPCIAEPAVKLGTGHLIHLRNGDQITASTLTLEKDRKLQFHSPRLQIGARFDIQHIDSIRLDHGKKLSPLKQPVSLVYFAPRFATTRGDILSGSLQEISTENVIIKPQHGSLITAKRAYISHIIHWLDQSGYYSGSSISDQWNIAPAGSWSQGISNLTSKKAGTAGIADKLSDLCKVSFVIEHTSTLRSKIFLFADTASNPKAYFELNLNRSYTYLRVRGKIGKRKKSNGARWKQLAVRPTAGKIQFDLYSDKKNGKFLIYINKKFAAELEADSGVPSDLGRSLIFHSNSNYTYTISNLSVTPWDGKKPTEEKKEKSNKLIPPHVQLINNKTIPFDSAKREGQQLRTLSGGKPQLIDFNQISRFHLNTSIVQGKKYAHDIRAWFTHRGAITFKLSGIKDGKISGSSQELGNVSFDLKAFALLEFNIYEPTADKK